MAVIGRRGALVLAAVALAGVSVWLGASWFGAAPPPDVVVITIDTLRPDFVGAERQTPALAEFLAGATHFARARTPVPMTLPSHLSLFSGLLPVRVGVHDNATAPSGAARGFPLLAEEFRAAGYATAAFVSSCVVGDGTGVEAGFETFDAPAPLTDFSISLAEHSAEERLPAALDWLRSTGGRRPRFLWVHFNDPHAPYVPYGGDAKRAATFAAAVPRVRYAGEVRRVDAAVEALLAAIPEDAIVVIASDHGEGLGDHDEPQHGALCFSSTVDVLLAVRAPALRAGAVDTAPRSLCDVAPTLRAWCGLPDAPHHGARLDGPPAAVVLTESLYGWRVHGWGQCFAAFDGRSSLVETGPRIEFFDRAKDPGETRPIDGAEHGSFETLDRALLALRGAGSGGGGSEPAPESITPYGMSGGRAVVYLSRAENARLGDPSEHLSAQETFERASGLIHEGTVARNPATLETAVALLESLVDENPNGPAARLYLANAQARLAAITGRAEAHAAAARSAAGAIALGSRAPSLLGLLLRESVASAEAEGMRSAMRTAIDSGIDFAESDAPSAVALACAVAARGDPSGARWVAGRLQRLRDARAGDAADLDALGASIQAALAGPPAQGGPR